MVSKLKIWFLNVGQGDGTYFEFTDSKGKVWRGLIDCNLDRAHKGVNVIQFLADRVPLQEENGKKFRYLDYLIVTHPHADHIRGIAEIGNDYKLGELWDSGHEPEDKNDNCALYEKYVAVKEKHKDVLHVEDRKMSRTPIDMCDGELQAHIFSPSRFITSAEDLDTEERREAIHSECMCFKLIFGEFAVLFAGDSNWLAWERITDYKHYDEAALRSSILHASHHGSRTFFRKNEDEEPLKTGIERIDPDHLIISVSDPSPHGHPHEDALEIYKEYVPEDEILYTHVDTLVLEVDDQGEYTLEPDPEIQEKYELGEDEEEDESSKGGTSKSFNVAAMPRTRLDDQGAA